MTPPQINFTPNYGRDFLNLAQTWLAFSIILGIIFLVVALVLIVLRKRIALAIELIQESSKAVAHMPGTLVWPLTPFILHVVGKFTTQPFGFQCLPPPVPHNLMIHPLLLHSLIPVALFFAGVALFLSSAGTAEYNVVAPSVDADQVNISMTLSEVATRMSSSSDSSSTLKSWDAP